MELLAKHTNLMAMLISNVHFRNHLHCSFLTDYMLNYNFYGIYMYVLIIYGVEHRHKISQRI